MDIHFIVSGITIIFYPEGYRIKKLIIINQFYISYSMYFFTSSDHFISSIGIYILN
jgi:hypothetical protein